MENVNNDDLSLLSEDFASGAIPSEKAEYLLNGVWVPEKVYLAWLEEQEDPPFSTVRKSMSYEEAMERYPDRKEEILSLRSRVLMINQEDYDEARSEIMRHFFLAKRLNLKAMVESRRASSTSSESFMNGEDHTPRSPDNG